MSTQARIPLARPSLGQAERDAVTRVLDSGRLVLGPENLAFEDMLARRTQTAHAVCTSSGTAALWAALWALDLEPGEILVPAFTFPAPAHVATALGFKVVPVDVDPATWNIDPDRVAQAWTPDTRALIAVDQFGLCADYDKLLPLAEEAGIPVVEDAACALGAQAGDRPAGSFGRMACFSFHPRKIITTGEGGCVVTDDEALVTRMRAYRHQGMAGPGHFTEVGMNLRLPEMAAAMGRVQLGELDGLLLGRAELVTLYRQQLEGIEGLSFQEPPDSHVHAWQTFAVCVPRGVDRAQVIARLGEAGIESGPATYAVHRIGSMKGLARAEGGEFPVADVLHDRSLALPLYGGMTVDEVGRVTEALISALKR